METVVCDSCPCLNNDIEQESQCNLGYDILYSDNNPIYLHYSINCQLVKIIAKDKNEILPEIIEDQTK